MSDYRNRSHYSYESRSQKVKRNEDNGSHREQLVKFKSDQKLIKRRYFEKEDKSTKQMTEGEVLLIKDKILKKLANQQKSVTGEKYVEWKEPIQLVTNGGIKRSDIYQQCEQRLKNVMPVYYNRVYQIPPSPKMKLQQSVNGGIQKIKFDCEELKPVQVNQGKLLEDLFEEGTSSAKYLNYKGNSLRSILKQNKQSDLPEVSLSDQEELTLSKLIKLLGLKVGNEKEFIKKTKQLLKTGQQDMFKLKRNLQMANEIIEKMHKFRLQNYNGKTITILPKKSIITNPIKDNKMVGVIPQSEFDKRKNSKLKTVPCVFYHSPTGCHHGDNCNFIHDKNYKGKPTPNMDKYTRPINQLSRNPQVNLQNMQRMHKAHYQPSQSQNNSRIPQKKFKEF